MRWRFDVIVTFMEQSVSVLENGFLVGCHLWIMAVCTILCCGSGRFDVYDRILAFSFRPCSFFVSN